ncbi:MAG: hypothetical protein DME50_18135 [Verrucomicrobia bacterium]|nr:MAG: hypothetical protein DME50_18135 [Verrucomicrobiota bacterium]
MCYAGLWQLIPPTRLRACSSSSSGKTLPVRNGFPLLQKQARNSLSTRLGDDGDFGNLIRVRDVKIEIVPIRSRAPSLQSFQESRASEVSIRCRYDGRVPFPQRQIRIFSKCR